jgi:1-acyl-sn-glycerol-3-phosphate acyltransferase
VSLRAVRRGVTLGLALLYCFSRSLIGRLVRPDTMERRAQWQHESGILVMRILGIRLTVKGPLPQGGLLVANHLSYLDIMIFSTALPVYLVSKIQISRWPFFGTLARAGGALFVDRSSRVSAEATTLQIADRLRSPVPVLFFPEGTSTDGTHLIPFHSRFYTPAVEAGIPVTAAAIRYIPEDGSPESELCWYGDDVFLTHVWKVLGASNFAAEVQFGEPRIYTDRRSATDATYDEIEAMRSSVPVVNA